MNVQGGYPGRLCAPGLRQPCYLEKLVQGDSEVVGELGQCFQTGALATALDIRQVSVGDARSLFDLPQGTVASQVPQEFSYGRPQPGGGVLVISHGIFEQLHCGFSIL